MPNKKKILCSCPPMIRAIETLSEEFKKRNSEVTCPEFTQTLSEDQLIQLVPQFDGWIIGDDPATSNVFQAGRSGKMRAAVKWGAGTDNVDFEGARVHGFEVSNTPGMFNEEVSDVALGYLINLARHLVEIDSGVKSGLWPKPSGISLTGKTVALVGFGNIGKSTARKLVAFGLQVIVYDPYFQSVPGLDVQHTDWPNRLNEADFVLLTCALTSSSHHMVNMETVSAMKTGVRIINVGRGSLIDENSLVTALASEKVHSAALDVLEAEPLPLDSQLRAYKRCLFGSHNSSNTVEAVHRTSIKAINQLFEQFNHA